MLPVLFTLTLTPTWAPVVAAALAIVIAGWQVRAAPLFVSRHEAPLGIVNATDAAADRNVKIVGTVPPPVTWPCVRMLIVHVCMWKSRRFISRVAY